MGSAPSHSCSRRLLKIQQLPYGGVRLTYHQSLPANALGIGILIGGIHFPNINPSHTKTRVYRHKEEGSSRILQYKFEAQDRSKTHPLTRQESIELERELLAGLCLKCGNINKCIKVPEQLADVLNKKHC